MTADELRAIRERFELAEKYFFDAVEHDLVANPPRTITEAVAVARFYRSVFADVRTLLAEVERKGMRLFEITNENLKLKAEVERLQDEALKYERVVDAAKHLSAEVNAHIAKCNPSFAAKHTGPELAAKIRRFNGGRE